MECSGFSWVLIALSLSHSLPLALTLNYNVLKSRQCEFESFVILVAMVTTPAFCGACVVVVVLSVSGVEGCAEPCWSAISQNPASHMQPHALVLFGLFFFSSVFTLQSLTRSPSCSRVVPRQSCIIQSFLTILHYFRSFY